MVKNIKKKIKLLGLAGLTLTGSMCAPLDDPSNNNSIPSNGLTYNTYQPTFQFRNGANSEHPKSKLYMSQIEKVPDQIQKIIANQGGKIILFNGPITQNAEAKYAAGMKAWDLTGWSSSSFDDVRACYIRGPNALFLGVEGKYLGINDPSKHEYGHAYDYLIGAKFFGKKISDLDNIKQAIVTEPFLDDYFTKPNEYVANSVDLFYESLSSRKRLQKNQPTMYNLLVEVEKKVINR